MPAYRICPAGVRLYMLSHLHVSKVGTAECGLHSEAVGDAHLTPHDHARGGLLALAHSELTPAERELVRSLGRKKEAFTVQILFQ